MGTLHLLQFDDAADRGRQTRPLRGFAAEMTPAGPRQRVELRPPVVLARAPFSLNPALLLELVQRGIERPVADLQHLARDLTEALADRPAVHRFERDDLE